MKGIMARVVPERDRRKKKVNRSKKAQKTDISVRLTIA